MNGLTYSAGLAARLDETAALFCAWARGEVTFSKYANTTTSIRTMRQVFRNISVSSGSTFAAPEARRPGPDQWRAVDHSPATSAPVVVWLRHRCFQRPSKNRKLVPPSPHFACSRDRDRTARSDSETFCTIHHQRHGPDY